MGGRKLMVGEVRARLRAQFQAARRGLELLKSYELLPQQLQRKLGQEFLKACMEDPDEARTLLKAVR